MTSLSMMQPTQLCKIYVPHSVTLPKFNWLLTVYRIRPQFHVPNSYSPVTTGQLHFDIPKDLKCYSPKIDLIFFQLSLLLYFPSW